MGEIIFSVFVGGWMVFTGIFLILKLNKEEKAWSAEESEGSKPAK